MQRRFSKYVGKSVHSAAMSRKGSREIWNNFVQRSATIFLAEYQRQDYPHSPPKVVQERAWAGLPAHPPWWQAGGARRTPASWGRLPPLWRSPASPRPSSPSPVLSDSALLVWTPRTVSSKLNKCSDDGYQPSNHSNMSGWKKLYAIILMGRSVPCVLLFPKTHRLPKAAVTEVSYLSSPVRKKKV